MPWYEYQCQSCLSRFEAHRSVEERAWADCECGGVGEKQLSRPQFAIPEHFKLKHVTAGWHLPRLENGKVDYSNLCRPGEIKPPPPEKTLLEHLNEEFLTRPKITLSSRAPSG